VQGGGQHPDRQPHEAQQLMHLQGMQSGNPTMHVQAQHAQQVSMMPPVQLSRPMAPSAFAQAHFGFQ